MMIEADWHSSGLESSIGIVVDGDGNDVQCNKLHQTSEPLAKPYSQPFIYLTGVTCQSTKFQLIRNSLRQQRSNSDIAKQPPERN